MAPQSKNGLDLSKPVGTKPSPRDVVIFRGGGTNHHPGSKMWRQMVDERKMDYIYAKTQKQKRAIVQDCINAHQANGGRYVGEYEGMFYLATPKKRYAKTIQRLRERSQQYKETIERDLPQPEMEFASGNQSDSETSSVVSENDWRRRPQSPGASCGSHSTMSTTASTASCSSGNGDCREAILTDEDAEALCALFPLPDFCPMPPPVTVCYHHHHHHHHHPSSMSAAAPTQTTTHQTTMQFASYSSASFAPQSCYAFEDDNDHYDDFPHFYPVDEVYTQ